MPGAGTGDPQPPASVARGLVAAKDIRVLVVDDYEDNAEMLGELLEQAGYEVRIAYTAAMALGAAVEFSPHVAILDLGMPDIDGADLARQLRALPGLAAVGLIAVTGYGRPADREKTLQAGFAVHLVKPVESPAILAALADVSSPKRSEAT
jgi:CheY-like chemotaxis protein